MKFVLFSTAILTVLAQASAVSIPKARDPGSTINALKELTASDGALTRRQGLNCKADCCLDKNGYALYIAVCNTKCAFLGSAGDCIGTCRK